MNQLCTNHPQAKVFNINLQNFIRNILTHWDREGIWLSWENKMLQKNFPGSSMWESSSSVTAHSDCRSKKKKTAHIYFKIKHPKILSQNWMAHNQPIIEPLSGTIDCSIKMTGFYIFLTMHTMRNRSCGAILARRHTLINFIQAFCFFKTGNFMMRWKPS